MKTRNLAIAIALSLGLVAGMALADRTDVWNSTTADWVNYCVNHTADGGASVEVWGIAKKQDGGTYKNSTGELNLAGANQTSALNIGSTLLGVWKTREGL